MTLVSKLGQVSFGDDALANLARCGVDTTHVHRTDRAPSGVAPIAVTATGANAIIVVAGANALLTEAEIEAARPAIAAAQVVVCQLELPDRLTAAALRIGREEGVTTILNPAPAKPEHLADFYAVSDIICPNETEAALLTGRAVDSLEDAEIAGRMLLGRGPKTVILTLGGRGCLLVTHDRAMHIPAESVTAVDTTGAGDAFVGSLAFFLAAGTAIETAARRANQIAAVSVQGRGTQTSFPDRAQLDDRLFA